MGFDNECILNIQNLAGEYFCPVCRMLVYPNEALQSQCTHLYCKHCLAYIVATTRACPYDGYLVTQEDSKPLLESNKTLAETIGKIAVHCLYHRSGCTWQGPLSDCSSHCSACAFGNSPVVCNRCAIQIMHRQVQEHAQSCPGARAAEGAVSSTASTNTLQMQATVQGATVSSQAHASQQQYYQQYPGYDPYQQHYQQYYQQHYPQQLNPHPPLQPQPQAQSLHPPAAQFQVQAITQQQPPSLAHPQPHAQIMPPAQHYPQSQAIDIGHKQQPHPMIRPQSQLLPNQHQPHPRASQHSNLHLQQVLIPQYQQSRPAAQTQPQPHTHFQAHLPVQFQQNSQVPQTWPPQAKYVNDYPSTSHMTGDHSYPLQLQSGLTQQFSGHSYPQGGPQQQQHPVVVRNQVSQQLTNPTWMQAVNHQQTPMHPLSCFNVAPPMPNETTQPRQNVPFPHNERPYQSQSQVLKGSVQQQVYPVTTEGMNKTGLALSGSHQHSETLIRSDNQPHSAAEQQGGYFQSLVGSQSESKHMSADDCPARVHMEGRETCLVEDKPSEVLLRMGASGDGVPSGEKGEERVNDSVKHISVGRSGSATNEFKEGDPDEVKSKLMDSQSIQPATMTDEISPDVTTPLAPLSASIEGLPSDVRPTSASLNTPFCKQPYLRHSGSSNETNFAPDGPKAWPDSSLASGLRDERFRAPRDTMLREHGPQMILQEDRLLFPRHMESELFCKQEGFFPSMPYEGDSLGFSKIPRPLGKALYGLHHDEHLQHDAFPKDNRLNLRHDVWSAASMYGRQFGVHYGSPDSEHPNTSSHTIRLGTDGRDHNLFSPKKPLNLSSALAEFSLISSNVPPHLHKGSLGSFSGLAHNAELSGNGNIRPPLSEMGFRSNFLLTENPFHKRDLELYDNLRKRKAATMGWCRICKVDCDTVEGLELHSQTREHQRMSMDMVMKIKQQNSKRQKLP